MTSWSSEGFSPSAKTPRSKPGNLVAEDRTPHALSRLLILGRHELQTPTSGVRCTKLTMRCTGHQGRCPNGQFLKDIFYGEKQKVTGSILTTHWVTEGLVTASGAVPPSPLCSTRGARSLYVVLDVREVCVRKKIRGRSRRTSCENEHTSRRNLSFK